MLKQISCDKFMDENGERAPIVFHEGLNSILGDKYGSNSIGKSTFLMIIDFCFGGEDYIHKEKETIQKVGEHTIYFIYEFDKEEKCFSRSTNTPNLVTVYTDNTFKKILRTVSLDTFKKGLLKYYKLDHLGLSFRDIVSRFFRIYNRQTHNELRPLNATVRQEDKLGIISLLKLYNSFSSIEQHLQTYNDAFDKKKTLENLRKYTSNSVAENKEEYARNQDEIKRLEEDLRILLEENANQISEQKIIECEEKDYLQKLRSGLRNERRKLVKKIDDINFDAQYDEIETTKNIEKLKKYFPNENFEEIEKINKFHKDVKNIIAKETRKDVAETQEMIAIIDKKIFEIDQRLKNYKSTPYVSDTIIKRHSYITSRLQKLIEANVNFIQKNNAVAEYKTADDNLTKVTSSVVKTIQDKINKQMEAYNKNIRRSDGKTNYPPTLDINALKGYSFYTPHDTGTGTRFKGVAIFDYTVLNQTLLPAIIHDSIIFNSIANDTLLDLFTLYNNQKNKQIFIAFDNPYSHGKEIQKILFNTKVISLSKEPNALFSKEFHTKNGY